MAFLALLNKELRMRMRRERTIWLLISYILVQGIAGWLVVNNSNNSLGTIGLVLFYFLSIFQLVLIIFIVPAFTATAINGEKERQTYDLLMCSPVTGFSLVMGKLVAGMTTSLLLIAASIPLFSLIFFFGGIAPAQLLVLLLIYLVTALLVGSFGIYCSTIFQRPAISTAISYVLNLIWCGSPLLIIFFWRFFTQQFPASSQIPLIYVWSPFAAIISISVPNGFSVAIGNSSIRVWIFYVLLNIVVSALLILLSIPSARPIIAKRHYRFMKKQRARHVEAAT